MKLPVFLYLFLRCSFFRSLSLFLCLSSSLLLMPFCSFPFLLSLLPSLLPPLFISSFFSFFRDFFIYISVFICISSFLRSFSLSFLSLSCCVSIMFSFSRFCCLSILTIFSFVCSLPGFAFIELFLLLSCFCGCDSFWVLLTPDNDAQGIH